MTGPRLGSSRRPGAPPPAAVAARQSRATVNMSPLLEKRRPSCPLNPGSARAAGQEQTGRAQTPGRQHDDLRRGPSGPARGGVEQVLGVAIPRRRRAGGSARGTRRRPGAKRDRLAARADCAPGAWPREEGEVGVFLRALVAAHVALAAQAAGRRARAVEVVVGRKRHVRSGRARRRRRKRSPAAGARPPTPPRRRPAANATVLRSSRRRARRRRDRPRGVVVRSSASRVWASARARVVEGSAGERLGRLAQEDVRVDERPPPRPLETIAVSAWKDRRRTARAARRRLPEVLLSPAGCEGRRPAEGHSPLEHRTEGGPRSNR